MLAEAAALLDETFASSGDSGIAITAKISLAEWFRRRDVLLTKLGRPDPRVDLSVRTAPTAGARCKRIGRITGLTCGAPATTRSRTGELVCNLHRDRSEPQI